VGSSDWKGEWNAAVPPPGTPCACDDEEEEEEAEEEMTGVGNTPSAAEADAERVGGAAPTPARAPKGLFTLSIVAAAKLGGHRRQRLPIGML
jgi:hypothetical protein